MKNSLAKSIGLLLLFVLGMFLAPAIAYQPRGGESSSPLLSSTRVPLTSQTIEASEFIQSLETGNWFIRTKAAKSIAELGPDVKLIMPELRKLTRHTDGFIRKVASDALTQIPPEPYIARLTDPEQSLLERIEAANLLGQIKSEKAIEPLLSVIQDKTLLNPGWTEENKEGFPLASRYFLAAASALSEISPEHLDVAIPELIHYIRNDEGGWVAIGLLGKLDSPESLRAISEELRTGDLEVDSVYINIISNLGFSYPQQLLKAFELMEPDKVVPNLASLLINSIESPGTLPDILRIAAANTLAVLGHQAIPDLLQAIPLPDLVASFVEVLDNGELKSALKDHGKKVDLFAIDVLHQAATTEEGIELIEDLIEMIQNQELDPWLRHYGARALGLMTGSHFPVKKLMANLKDPGIRCNIATGLSSSFLDLPSNLPVSNQHNQEVLSLLSDIIRNPQSCAISFNVALAAARLGDRSVVPILWTMVLPTVSPGLEPVSREAAAYWLGQLGDPQSVWALTEALLYPYDPSEPNHPFETYWSRNDQAAAALGQIGTEDAIASLIKGLKHEDWFIRRSSTEALATLGSKAVPALLELISANSNQSLATQDLETHVQKADLRRSALYVLSLIGQPAQSAMATVEAIMQDEDEVFEIREMAQTAVVQIHGDYSTNSSSGTYNAPTSLGQTCPDINLNTYIYAGRCVYPDLPVWKVGCCGSWSRIYRTMRSVLNRN